MPRYERHGRCELKAASCVFVSDVHLKSFVALYQVVDPFSGFDVRWLFQFHQWIVLSLAV